MNVELNNQSVKDGISRMNAFLEENRHNIARGHIYEAVSRFFNYESWNVMAAVLNSPAQSKVDPANSMAALVAFEDTVRASPDRGVMPEYFLRKLASHDESNPEFLDKMVDHDWQTFRDGWIAAQASITKTTDVDIEVIKNETATPVLKSVDIFELSNKADDLFELYEFGDEVTVEATSGWTWYGLESCHRKVFVHYDDDPEDSDTDALDFTIKFDKRGRAIYVQATGGRGHEVGVIGGRYIYGESAIHLTTTGGLTLCRFVLDKKFQILHKLEIKGDNGWYPGSINEANEVDDNITALNPHVYDDPYDCGFSVSNEMPAWAR